MKNLPKVHVPTLVTVLVIVLIVGFIYHFAHKH
jgi:hypothetical protein